MLCWEASISLPGKHPSRLKWQAKACKNLLLTPFFRHDSSPPAAPPALQHRCTAAWESCRSLAWEQEKEMVLLPWAPEEIRASLAAVKSHIEFPAYSQGSFHSSFSGKTGNHPPGSHPAAPLGDAAGAWYRHTQMCPAVGQGNDQQRDHSWVCAAQTMSCRAAGTTHSFQAASMDLTLGITAIRSQDRRLQEPQESSTELSSWLDLQLALGLLLCICTFSLLPLSQRYSPGSNTARLVCQGHPQLQEEVMGDVGTALPEHKL